MAFVDWDNLDGASMKSLKAEAAAQGIYIPPRSRKAEIIRTLQENRSKLESPDFNLLKNSKSHTEIDAHLDKKYNGESGRESTRKKEKINIPLEYKSVSIPEDQPTLQKQNTPNIIKQTKFETNEHRFPSIPTPSFDDIRQASPPIASRYSSDGRELPIPPIEAFLHTSAHRSSHTHHKDSLGPKLPTSPTQCYPKNIFRVSGLTKFLNTFFIVVSFMAFFGILFNPIFFGLSVLCFIMLSIVRLIRHLEVKSKASKLLKMCNGDIRYNYVMEKYCPDTIILKNAIKMQNKQRPKI